MGWLEAKMKRPPTRGNCSGTDGDAAAAQWDKIFPFSTPRRVAFTFCPLYVLSLLGEMRFST